MLFEICSSGHEEVVYIGKSFGRSTPCPTCEVIKERDDLSKMVAQMKEDMENLQEQLDLALSEEEE